MGTAEGISDSDESDLENISGDENASDESEEVESDFEYEDIMQPGTDEEIVKNVQNSRQFKANLNALFRSVYDCDKE